MTDQEIRDALRVDPSPEFLARVRTRVASEPAPSAWRWSWTAAAVGALAAMVLIAVVMSRPKQERPSAPDVVQALTPSRATESDKVPAGPEGPALQQTEPTRSAPVRRPGPFGPGRSIAAQVASARTPTPEPASAALPEILLDPAETHALRQLIAGVRDGRIDLTAAQKSSSPAPLDLEPVTDIVIAPITIEPIAPLSGAEGVRP
jgi:hypothetical protein